MDFPIARSHFYHEVNQSDDQIDLGRAALYIAQETYPHLDPDEYLAALDTMATEVEERLPNQRYPMRVLQILNHYLYEDLGFRGNSDHYYDPRNSFLNQVMDRRMGIPLTLSLVYLEVARRIDFPMVGIGMPGHFLIRPEFESVGIFVDPFQQGEILFPEDCQDRLQQIYGSSVQLQDRFLEPVGPRAFLVRMLTNLKMIYLNQGDLVNALSMSERIMLVRPKHQMERRDRGLIYYQLGRWTEARQDLEDYLSNLPSFHQWDQDAIMIRTLLDQLQSDED